jgi:hypothetical protein
MIVVIAIVVIYLRRRYFVMDNVIHRKYFVFVVTMNIFLIGALEPKQMCRLIVAIMNWLVFEIQTTQGEVFGILASVE